MQLHTYPHENNKPLGREDKWQRDVLTNRTTLECQLSYEYGEINKNIEQTY